LPSGRQRHCIMATASVLGQLLALLLLLLLLV
jgi:hypothetical protein